MEFILLSRYEMDSQGVGTERGLGRAVGYIDHTEKDKSIVRMGDILRYMRYTWGSVWITLQYVGGGAFQHQPFPPQG